MSPDLASLRAAYASDPDFAAVFRVLAAGRNAPAARVRRLVQGGRSRRETGLEREQVSRVFEQLAAWGFGDFADPRSERRARLLWRVRPKTVIALAAGRLETIPDTHWVQRRSTAATAAPAAAPGPVGPPPLPEGWERHRVALAPGREAELIVPPDLAPDEGRWLGDYLERNARRTAQRAKEKPAG